MDKARFSPRATSQVNGESGRKGRQQALYGGQKKILHESLFILGAELSKSKNQVQSGAVTLVDAQETISPCLPQMDQEVQQARPACDQAPEMIGKAG